MTLTKKGFTLLELLVVVSMIALIMGALTTSVSSARERARVQKANAEVRAITQAILGYESWNRDNELEEINDPKDADAETLGFLLGRETGTAAEGGQSQKIPVLLMAQHKAGGKMLDPWGTPYKITIRKGTIDAAASVSLKTGFALPNFYRLAPDEL